MRDLHDKEYHALCVTQKLALFDWLLDAFYETEFFVSLMKKHGSRKEELLKEKMKVCFCCLHSCNALMGRTGCFWGVCFVFLNEGEGRLVLSRTMGEKINLTWFIGGPRTQKAGERHEIQKSAQEGRRKVRYVSCA